jgi:hypothetical protein
MIGAYEVRKILFYYQGKWIYFFPPITYHSYKYLNSLIAKPIDYYFNELMLKISGAIAFFGYQD